MSRAASGCGSTQTLSGKAEEGDTLHSGLPTTEAQGDPSSGKSPKACKNWSMGRKMIFEGKKWEKLC